MRRTRNNRRRFQWLRVAGGNLAVNTADGAGAFGGVDLLSAARNQYGQLLDAGATVMSIKGFVKPRVTFSAPGATFYTGRLAIGRIAKTQMPAREEDAPGSLQSEEDPWMWINPFIFDTMGSSATVNPLIMATSDAGTRWSVNIRSHRIISSLNTTLGLYHSWFQPVPSSPTGALGMNYDLSIGVKLP